MNDLLTYRDAVPQSSVERASVLLPVALDQTYDYAVPAGVRVRPGDFVLVPFANQQRIGIVWDHAPGSGKHVEDAKLKEILCRLDVPALPPVSRRFAEWVARYTLSPLGMVARMMMSASHAFEPSKPRMGVRLAGPPPPRMTPARKRMLEIAGDGLIRARSALAEEAGSTSAVVSGLVKSGTLVEVEIPEPKFTVPDAQYARPEFSESQAVAAHALRAGVAAKTGSTILLDGVTGSGKTEVYFEAVAQALALGRQALILLPEIALTGQFVARFKARFGVAPVEWHSAISASGRGRIWRAVANGEVRAVIGARSGLFLPFLDLGVIVVDEEHDTGFKQEDRVNYQARDMAVVRGGLGDHPVVLVSATPSLESHVNARSGRYRYVELGERFSGAELPDVTAIDMRCDPPLKGDWLSPVLINAMRDTFSRGQQSLLFLNRRGYAPLTLCRGCGHRLDCPQCAAWLVEHRFRGRLTCHHCGFSMPVPRQCPNCEAEEALVPCGPGVERVAEEVTAQFPGARIAILSSDLAPGLEELRKVLAAIANGEVDIIIGTQIVAKGHHFPGLATVGIVDGDLGLGQADPRASERTFQLLHQVTGRAGRAQISGRGFVQTHMPEHPVMQAIISGDRDAFLDREIALRQAGLYPPFGRLVAVLVSAKEKARAEDYARAVARSAPPAQRIAILGPAEAPIAVIRGRHRYRILVKAPREIDVQTYLRAWLENMPKAKGDIRLTVDIDPYSFL